MHKHVYKCSQCSLVVQWESAPRGKDTCVHSYCGGTFQYQGPTTERAMETGSDARADEAILQVDPRLAEVVSAATALRDLEGLEHMARQRHMQHVRLYQALDALPTLASEQRSSEATAFKVEGPFLHRLFRVVGPRRRSGKEAEKDCPNEAPPRQSLEHVALRNLRDTLLAWDRGNAPTSSLFDAIGQANAALIEQRPDYPRNEAESLIDRLADELSAMTGSGSKPGVSELLDRADAFLAKVRGASPNEGGEP